MNEHYFGMVCVFLPNLHTHPKTWYTVLFIRNMMKTGEKIINLNNHTSTSAFIYLRRGQISASQVLDIHVYDIDDVWCKLYRRFFTNPVITLITCHLVLTDRVITFWHLFPVWTSLTLSRPWLLECSSSITQALTCVISLPFHILVHVPVVTLTRWTFSSHYYNYAQPIYVFTFNTSYLALNWEFFKEWPQNVFT